MASAEEFVVGFDYPMFIVTTVNPVTEARAGCLVGFATQSSIDPFRLLICLSRENFTYQVAETATFLAVHVLGEDDEDLIRLFGGETGDEIDKFTRCAWRPGPGGVPLLSSSPRRFVGRILGRFDLGDHVGFLLAPEEVQIEGEADPAGFQEMPDVEPGHPAE